MVITGMGYKSNSPPEVDLRKRALSAAYGVPFRGVEFEISLLEDPRQISVVSKSEKKKKSVYGHWVPSLTYLFACTTFTFFSKALI